MRHEQGTKHFFKTVKKSGKSDAAEILPTLEGLGLEALQSSLSRSQVYLEYGCGGSTLIAASDPKRVVVSVDSHPAWIDKVRAAVAQSSQRTATIHLLTAELGPVVQWGYPATNRRFKAWHNYPLMPWQFCQRSALQPDLVFIDGRFRVASFCACYLAAEPGTRILFDDYTVRPPYHVTGDLLKPTALHGRMAEFVVPERKDQVAAAFLLARYSLVPR